MSAQALKHFLKNFLFFFAVFLIINYILQTFISPEKDLSKLDNNLIIQTSNQDYSPYQTVTVEIINNRQKPLLIPSDCPGEPLNVFHYQNNQWLQITASPEIDCPATGEIVVNPGEKIKIPYQNWNYSLFSKLGRFRIELKTTIEEEEKTISSNEFLIVEEGIFRKLWVGVFYKPIYNGLIFFAKILPGHSLGLAIILLTIIIRTILLIPSQKALRSQKRMQDIQPRLEKIKEKHKGDQQKIAAETMAIWKESKVNPLGSCLPLLLQFPFLIALFYVIQDGLNPDKSFLLYTSYQNFQISDINTYFLGLDLKKANVYILPFIIGGLQFLQLKMTMSKQKKKLKNGDLKQPKEVAMAGNMMTYVLPVMIAVFTASLPAGVGIYWGISTLYGIVQQLFVNRESGFNKSEVKVRVLDSKK